MEEKVWYGCRTLYQIQNGLAERPNKLYEERIVLLKANSFDAAIAEAKKEAKQYANDDSGIVYLEYVDVFKLFDEKIRDKTEVYSLMRESRLGVDRYIDRHFTTGKERTHK